MHLIVSVSWSGNMVNQKKKRHLNREKDIKLSMHSCLDNFMLRGTKEKSEEE